MIKSALLEVCRSLSSTETRELKKFIRSPFFNQREDVTRLFDHIQSALKAGKEKALEKEAAFRYVFGNTTYHDAQMRYAMSFLLQLIRQYLTFKESVSDPVQEKTLMVRALRNRRLDELFEKEWTEIRNFHAENIHRNIHHHYFNYLLHQEHYEYAALHQRSGDLQLQEMTNELTIYYVANVLRWSCVILTLQHLSSRNYELPLLAPILRLLEEGKWQEVPAVSIYYSSYKALSEPDNDEHFRLIKENIRLYRDLFTEKEIRDIYLMAINYCIQRHNRGASTYMNELFELYQYGLSQKILFENGYLSRFTYKNAATTGLWLKEFDWVASFLKEYKVYLHPGERENTYLYNLALFYFRQPDYDKAMELLQQVEFKDVFYNLDGRRMLLRIYFELNETDALNSLLDSFAIYIRRQKGLGGHRDNYLNLIRFIRKLQHLRPKDTEAIEALKTEIKETTSLAERRWLLQQLEKV
jgi:hypothetical protein